MAAITSSVIQRSVARSSCRPAYALKSSGRPTVMTGWSIQGRKPSFFTVSV
jgi:hypothetical protein